jgi:ABC-type iron transport system FetAB permease component
MVRNWLISNSRYCSVGLITIPGMMTGAILGGADVAQAARMQMVGYCPS